MSLLFTNKEEGRIEFFKNSLLSGDKDICTSVHVAGQSQDGQWLFSVLFSGGAS